MIKVNLLAITFTLQGRLQLHLLAIIKWRLQYLFRGIKIELRLSKCIWNVHLIKARMFEHGNEIAGINSV